MNTKTTRLLYVPAWVYVSLCTFTEETDRDRILGEISNLRLKDFSTEIMNDKVEISVSLNEAGTLFDFIINGLGKKHTRNGVCTESGQEILPISIHDRKFIFVTSEEIDSENGSYTEDTIDSLFLDDSSQIDDTLILTFVRPNENELEGEDE